MIDIDNFGNRLEKCMKNAGISNTELTQRLNISKNVIGNYKNNQIPNAKILYEISQELGTTIEYLLTGKENKLTENEKELLEKFKLLPDREQIKIIGIIENKVKELNIRGKSSHSEAV